MLATAVSHPGVVEIHDCFEAENGSPVLVMELLQGETLAALLRRERLAPESAALIVAYNAAGNSRGRPVRSCRQASPAMPLTVHTRGAPRRRVHGSLQTAPGPAASNPDRPERQDERLPDPPARLGQRASLGERGRSFLHPGNPEPCIVPLEGHREPLHR